MSKKLGGRTARGFSIYDKSHFIPTFRTFHRYPFQRQNI